MTQSVHSVKFIVSYEREMFVMFMRMAVRLQRILRKWCRRMREREQLARLSDLDLRDIGLTPADAWAEFSKPFWRR